MKLTPNDLEMIRPYSGVLPQQNGPCPLLRTVYRQEWR